MNWVRFLAGARMRSSWSSPPVVVVISVAVAAVLITVVIIAGLAYRKTQDWQPVPKTATPKAGQQRADLSQQSRPDFEPNPVPVELLGRWVVVETITHGTRQDHNLWASIEFASDRTAITRTPKSDVYPVSTNPRRALFLDRGRIELHDQKGAIANFYGYWQVDGETLELRLNLGHGFLPDSSDHQKIPLLLRFRKQK